MTTAKPDTDILSGTSFATPGARSLAARSDRIRARGVLERTQAALRQAGPDHDSKTQPTTATETVRKTLTRKKGTSIPGAKPNAPVRRQVKVSAKNGRIRIVALTDNGTTVSNRSAGPASTTELIALNRWVTSARRKSHSEALESVAPAVRQQLRRYLRVRRSRIDLCKRLLEIHAQHPNTCWPLLDVVRGIRTNDLPPNEAARRGTHLRILNIWLEKQAHALLALTQSAMSAPSPCATDIQHLVGEYLDTYGPSQEAAVLRAQGKTRNGFKMKGSLGAKGNPIHMPGYSKKYETPEIRERSNDPRPQTQ